MGGSSKKQTVGYKYFVGMQFTLCQGSVDVLKEARVDEKKLDTFDMINQVKFIAKGNLFGGESGEGGVSGYLRISNGNPTQMPNPYLTKVIGEDIPAFRGVTTIVASGSLNNYGGFYVGLNPYLKSWDFLVQRIHLTDQATTQWYDEKSAIPVSFADSESPALVPIMGDGWYGKVYQNTITKTAPQYIPSDAELSDPIAMTIGYWNNVWWPDYAINTPMYRNSTAWLRRTITCTGKYDIQVSGTIQENITFIYFDGQLIKTIEPTISSAGKMETPYSFSISKSLATQGTHTFHVCTSDALSSQGVFVVRLQFYMFAQYAPYNGMNPVHIIHEILCSNEFGLGLDPDNDLNDANFKSVADRLYDESFGLCLMWDGDSSNANEFIDDVLRHVNGVLRLDRATGKYEIKLIREDSILEQSFEPLILDKTNIKSFTKFQRVSVDELCNMVQVTYRDIFLLQDAVISVSDIAMYQMQGTIVSTKQEYKGIPNGTLADRVAQRDLIALSSPIVSATIVADSTVAMLQIGDVFTLNWPDYNISDTNMRVSTINYGDGLDNAVTIECVEDVFITPEQAIMASDENPQWVDPNQQPIPLVHKKIFETPYIDLVFQNGQFFVDGTLSEAPDEGVYSITATQAQSASNAAIVYDTTNGDGLETAGTLFYCAYGSLQDSITQLTTNFTIKDLELDIRVTVGQLAYIDDELVSIQSFNSISGAVVVRRGLFDTAPVNHSAGATILFYQNYSYTSEATFAASESVGVTLSPMLGTGQLDVSPSSTPEMSLEFNSRAIRPYPMGNLKINNAYFPSKVSDDLVVTWASRNRLFQTATANFISFTSGNVTSEDDVTYGYTIGDQNEQVWKTVNNIAALTTTITIYSLFELCQKNGNNWDIRLSFYSQRSGYKSYTSVVCDLEVDYIVVTLKTDLPTLNDGDVINLQLESTKTPTVTVTSEKWSISSGKLPDGLTMNDSGFITGTFTKTSATTYPLTFNVIGYNNTSVMYDVDLSEQWAVSATKSVRMLTQNNRPEELELYPHGDIHIIINHDWVMSPDSIIAIECANTKLEVIYKASFDNDTYCILKIDNGNLIVSAHDNGVTTMLMRADCNVLVKSIVITCDGPRHTFSINRIEVGHIDSLVALDNADIGFTADHFQKEIVGIIITPINITPTEFTLIGGPDGNY